VPAGFPGQRPQMGMGVGRSPYGLGRPQRAGFGPPGLLNPQVISIFTNLFLQARPAALFFLVFFFCPCPAQAVQHARGCLPAPAPQLPCLQRPPARGVCDARTHHDDSLLLWRQRQGRAPDATDAAQGQRPCPQCGCSGQR
jgi:hypothetical protein